MARARRQIFCGYLTKYDSERVSGKTDFLAATGGVQFRQQIGDSRLHGSGDRFRGGHAETKNKIRQILKGKDYDEYFSSRYRFRPAVALRFGLRATPAKQEILRSA